MQSHHLARTHTRTHAHTWKITHRSLLITQPQPSTYRAQGAGAPGPAPPPSPCPAPAHELQVDGVAGCRKQSEVWSPFLSLRLSLCVPSPGSNFTICYNRNRCCVSPEVSSLPVSHLAGLLSQLVCFQLREDSSSLPRRKLSIRVGAWMVCV